MSTPKTASDFGEPWDFDGENWITDSHNAKILNLDSIHSKNAKRLIACVNACAGMADPAAEMQAMREAIREAHEALKELRSFYLDMTGLPPCAANATLAKLRPLL